MADNMVKQFYRDALEAFRLAHKGCRGKRKPIERWEDNEEKLKEANRG